MRWPTVLSYRRMEWNARARGGGWERMRADRVGGIIDRRRIWLAANTGSLVAALTG